MLDGHFRAQTFPTLKSVSPESWRLLFQDYPLLPETAWLVEETETDISIGSIVVTRDEIPVLYLPVFIIDFPIEQEDLEDWQIKLVKQAPREWVCPDGLVVGFLEGECGAVGILPGLPAKDAEIAWQLALQELEALGSKIGIEFFVFFDFSEGQVAKLPRYVLEEYGRWDCIPYACLNVKYNSLDEYMSSLHPDMARYLRQRVKKTPPFTVIRTRNPEPWLDEIYRSYQAVVQKSDYVVGVLQPEFFQQVTQVDPTAEFALFFDEAGGQFLAFTLQFITPERFLYKYIGMHPEVGREYNLFFITWLENLRYCIERGIPVYDAGNTHEETKRRLGATLQPRATLYRHRNPEAHHLFKACEPQLSYNSPVSFTWPETQP